ncbi:hypothetical protein KTE28_03645 [Burkholderia multivorans]|uniref:hypothetical protein n=1 Tax=Burkholderia multivorans TaxID=87883 RepID=UPI001C279BBD|nr:hypothetical protein [Burkholderia multivorans]MBU9373426.1 hypothetical protein [Burkholderia multivorans]
MAKIEVTNSMIAEAMDIGTKSGLFVSNPRREDVVKMIQGVLSVVGNRDAEKFNCRVRSPDGKQDLRGRIIGPAPERRGFFRVETEDGRQIFLSGNEIYPYSTYKAR